MKHTDSGCEMIIDVTDLEVSAKALADKINELTEKDFANGKELQNEQLQNNVMRKRKGR